MPLNPEKYQNKYRSATARAVWHDYNEGDYFITICTQNRRHFFGRIVNQEMLFSEIGTYAAEYLAGDSEQ